MTKLIAKENRIESVDEDGFKEEMQQQKNRSRAATVIDTEDWIILNENAQDQNLLVMILLKQKAKF